MKKLMTSKVVIAIVCLILSGGQAHAQAASSLQLAVDADYEELIPHHLLGLAHAPEVHEELGLSQAQIGRLEALFAELDGPWFRSRIIQPADRQRQIVMQLEQRLRGWFRRFTSDTQQTRLRQLELRAQGIRMLLRKDLTAALGLEAEQTERLAELARATVAANKALAAANRSGEATDDARAAVASALVAEQEGPKTVLRPEQMQRLAPLIGEPFDTASLKRIYPTAPEFVAVDDWLNSKPMTMKQLKGKVVLVHFYAFQCHNCHANFPHYQRWHEQFNGEDVVVLGIQTPETPSERDTSLVRDAAQQRGLEFPIIVDLESKNWQAWANTMWPTIYVIDKNGYIRFWWQGELNWKGATVDQDIDRLIADLLQEEYNG